MAADEADGPGPAERSAKILPAAAAAPSPAELPVGLKTLMSRDIAPALF